jgi:hypothetical protein
MAKNTEIKPVQPVEIPPYLAQVSKVTETLSGLPTISDLMPRYGNPNTTRAIIHFDTATVQVWSTWTTRVPKI